MEAPPKPKPKRVRSKHPKFRKGGNGTDPEHVAPGPGEAPSFRSLPWKRKPQACLLPVSTNPASSPSPPSSSSASSPASACADKKNK
ncbi:hypothetical protein HAV15_007687 [Penicillium sp. str. |nr:hypothetical protein HAV15_007687 [Penicillium sp. str. \